MGSSNMPEGPYSSLEWDLIQEESTSMDRKRGAHNEFNSKWGAEYTHLIPAFGETAAGNL